MLKLESLEVYQQSMKVGELIWDIVVKWDYFAKDTVGKQLVKASDSVAANISEGYGRFHYKENKQFCHYARGSLYETITWLKKAFVRQLINESEHNMLQEKLEIISKQLNSYIKSIGRKN